MYFLILLMAIKYNHNIYAPIPLEQGLFILLEVSWIIFLLKKRVEYELALLKNIFFTWKSKFNFSIQLKIFLQFCTYTYTYLSTFTCTYTHLHTITQSLIHWLTHKFHLYKYLQIFTHMYTFLHKLTHTNTVLHLITHS